MSIILNISGKIFRVPRDVICKSQLFDGMLADCDIDSEIMIDRSSKLFKHVYAYLLDNKYPYPKKYYSELDYYLVPYEIDSLYDPNKLLSNEIEKIKKDIINLKEYALESKDNLIEICNKIDELPVRDEETIKECAYTDCQDRCMYKEPTCSRHLKCCCYYKRDGYGCVVEYCYVETNDGEAYCYLHHGY